LKSEINYKYLITIVQEV